MNEVIHGNCVEAMAGFPNEYIDLTITSPPYDNLRKYKGYTFDFIATANQLFRITKKGGVLVWVIGDSTVEGSETGVSFKQALYFKEIGFKLHDTMIYGKKTCPFPSKVRYNASFEYMFIFSKDKPNTINLIKDRPNITAGRDLKKRISTRRQVDGSLIQVPEHRRDKIIGAFGVRSNIWYYKTGIGMHSSKIAHNHPATFPEQLACDHILSWSNEKDLVLDPMCGSGTTLLAARQLNRNYIGIDCSQEYIELTKKRLSV